MSRNEQRGLEMVQGRLRDMVGRPVSDFLQPGEVEQLEKMTPEERQVGAGRELLKTLREMFDDRHLGQVLDFDTWLQRAPLDEKARQAIALARARDQEKS